MPKEFTRILSKSTHITCAGLDVKCITTRIFYGIIPNTWKGAVCTSELTRKSEDLTKPDCVVTSFQSRVNYPVDITRPLIVSKALKLIRHLVFFRCILFSWSESSPNKTDLISHLGVFKHVLYFTPWRRLKFRIFFKRGFQPPCLDAPGWGYNDITTVGQIPLGSHRLCPWRLHRNDCWHGWKRWPQASVTGNTKRTDGQSKGSEEMIPSQKLTARTWN